MNEELLLILKGLTYWNVLYGLIRSTNNYITGYWVFWDYSKTLLELSQRGSTGEEVG